MFAFALWDRQERALFLCRDRIGKKPLYYGQIDKTFVFASELKALCALPFFKREIDRDVLALLRAIQLYSVSLFDLQKHIQSIARFDYPRKSW